MTEVLDRVPLEDAFSRLGLDARAEDATLLSGPYSGTRTYLVRRAEGDVVLKVADAADPDRARARAIREARFFAELAPLIPIHVPRLLASSTDGPVVLLFAAYPVAPPARDWSLADFEAFARDMASLHARFWGNLDSIGNLEWLNQPGRATSAEEIATAGSQWAGLKGQEHLSDLLTASVLSMIDRLLGAMPALDAAFTSLPVCLCHGDCHSGNLLLDPEAPGSFIWADWQEVGLGRGPEELSFFVQRAMTDGADVPEDLLYECYHRRLSELAGPVSPRAIARIAAASELRTRVLQWPHYLAHLPSAATALSIQRIASAAETLGLR